MGSASTATVGDLRVGLRRRHARPGACQGCRAVTLPGIHAKPCRHHAAASPPELQCTCHPPAFIHSIYSLSCSAHATHLASGHDICRGLPGVAPTGGGPHQLNDTCHAARGGALGGWQLQHAMQVCTAAQQWRSLCAVCSACTAYSYPHGHGRRLLGSRACLQPDVGAPASGMHAAPGRRRRQLQPTTHHPTAE